MKKECDADFIVTSLNNKDNKFIDNFICYRLFHFVFLYINTFWNIPIHKHFWRLRG